jgi:nucleoside phosphorylase
MATSRRRFGPPQRANAQPEIMMNRVLVAFALKEEMAPWRRRHHFRTVSNSPHALTVTSFGNTEVYVALAGAGAPDAGHFNDLAAHMTPSLGIVTGVAAGLKPEWRPGDLLAAQSVCDLSSEAGILAAPGLVNLAVQCGAKPARSLVTLPHIARTIEEKLRLASLGDAADMESLPLMKQWSAHGIPSLALRVILDPVEMPMTCDFEEAMDRHGQVQITKILGQLARHPQVLPDFIHLARLSRRCLMILARFLDRFFERLDLQSPTWPPAPIA